MAADNSLAKLIDLMERQIALDLHFKGTSQDTIARILRKRKSWVNELLQGLPKRNKS
jgi:hypothetical protein